jgi:large subunit ribosomal protein L19e
MNLKNKKELAAKVLKVGVNRISINYERRNELKEAITRQDIKELEKEGVINIKEITPSFSSSFISCLVIASFNSFLLS